MVGIALAFVLSVMIVMVVMKLRRPSDPPQRPMNLAHPLEEDKDMESRPINHHQRPPANGSSILRVKDSNGNSTGGSVDSASVMRPVNGNGGLRGGANEGVMMGGGGASNGGSSNGYLTEPLEDNDPDVIPHKSGE